MSLSAPSIQTSPVPVLRFFDVVLLLVAAPILLLIGVPSGGYLAGAGAWIALRAVGVVVERVASGTEKPSREITLRLAYLMSRLFLLALTVILVRQDGGRDAGLTALLVIVAAFSIEMIVSAATRPRRR